MEISGKPQRIAVCIPSYRRPGGLHALLGALQQLRFEAGDGEVVLVVVDNDADGSALPVCESARGWLRFPLRYAREPRKGIPFARNAALAAAADADWIAFVDDDEVPDPGWLAELVRVQRETGADVVTGPVLPRFEVPPPAWLEQGGFFAATRRATGTRLDTAYTNNLLARVGLLAASAELFDLRLTRGVGEDTELFSRLASQGARIVWADEAVVHEAIPPKRARLRWLIARSYSVGTATTHIALRRAGGSAAVQAIAHGGWCLAKGLLLAALHAASRARCVQGLELAAFGCGRLARLLGVR
jgi:glycosyltransferase involved in cell wall biosynthesis